MCFEEGGFMKGTISTNFIVVTVGKLQKAAWKTKHIFGGQSFNPVQEKCVKMTVAECSFDHQKNPGKNPGNRKKKHIFNPSLLLRYFDTVTVSLLCFKTYNRNPIL